MQVKSSRFPKTTETLIHGLLSSKDSVRDFAFSRFSDMYHAPLCGFGRSLGLQEQDARDHTQDFFVKIMKEGMLQKFDPQRGTKFSTWLRICFRNFVRKKRGSEKAWISVATDFSKEGFQSAYLAVLAPEPVFDLLLARQIWKATREEMLKKAQKKGSERLVYDVLSYTLLTRWPESPAPSQEDIAARHGTSVVRLKAYFNRTLKVQARRDFGSEARAVCPGITDDDVQHLWHLLSRYGEI